MKNNYYSENEFEFMESHLKQHGNVACGRKIIKKHGAERLLLELSERGYDCTFELATQNPKGAEKYPRDATYILWLKKSFKEETTILRG